MADKAALHRAKMAKNDEFYTQYADIQAEINAYLEYDPDTFRGKTVLLPCDDPEESNFTRYFAENFTHLGLKKLVSTSYAPDAKKSKYGAGAKIAHKRNLDPKRGRVMVIDHDANGDGKINFKDLEWRYLDGDGDFRSEEVKKFRDEADVIVTNPPFSMFREFLKWILEGREKQTDLLRSNGLRGKVSGVSREQIRVLKQKKFLVIGNMNAITYKEVFPLIKENKIWLGCNQGGSRKGNSMFFVVPENYENDFVETHGSVRLMQTTGKWFTNLEHGRRHLPLQLMTMAQNAKYSRHKEIRGVGYRKYDNYDAIEVPHTDAIPSDYGGVMGVPVSFLDKYCPEQFEIVRFRKGDDGKDLSVDGKSRFFRILIRHRKDASK